MKGKFTKVGKPLNTLGKEMYMALKSSDHMFFSHKKGDVLYVIFQDLNEIIFANQGRQIVTVPLNGNEGFKGDYFYLGTCPININE